MKGLRIAALLAALVLGECLLLQRQKERSRRGESKPTPVLAVMVWMGIEMPIHPIECRYWAGSMRLILADALRAYQSGDRQHPTMRALAVTLSEQDILDISAFFESAGAGR